MVTWTIVSYDDELTPSEERAFKLLEWADRASRGNCTQCGKCPLGEHKEPA